ncbi:L-threonylcarbamoyladenylate synthase [Desulfovibrio sp.]|uniref:L-threonylcarbamoyladenylate synthase n=1 Tax=Desulfovibrio sp. TaxID=885 RepID=UPI0025C5A71E|nr:L-threonylcarbamoyladenylate synthase [Desulfovibrio sp.]
MSLQIVCRDLQEAVACLRGGHALIFPTETFYGLGCLASDAAAVSRIYQLKRRPVHKPLPLLAASEEQVRSVAQLEAMPEALRAFWPGPLTVLLPARQGLPAQLVNEAGQVAVRVTPHPVAAALAQGAGGPLTASSANLNGRPPVCTVADIDPQLLATLREMGQCPCVAAEGPQPQGGAPSSLVELLPEQGERYVSGSCRRLRVVRSGAVSRAALAAAGFMVES